MASADVSSGGTGECNKLCQGAILWQNTCGHWIIPRVCGNSGVCCGKLYYALDVGQAYAKIEEQI